MPGKHRKERAILITFLPSCYYTVFSPRLAPDADAREAETLMHFVVAGRNIDERASLLTSPFFSAKNYEALKENIPTANKPQSDNTTLSQKERMTDKRDRVTFYLNPGQLDKLEELRTEYRKATGKRINEQDLMRKIIDRLTLDLLLESETEGK